MASSASVAGLARSLEVQRMSIGRVFERAWSVVRHKPALMVAVALLAASAGVFGTYVLQGIDRSALVLTVAGYALPGAIALFLFQLFVSSLIGVIVQGVMIPAFLSPAQGMRANLRFGAALVSHSLLPLIAFAVLTGIAIVIGTTLLIFPAILISVLWSVAPSALVAEGDGLFLALDRSHELTQGARWKVFALLLILELINAVLGLVTIFLATRVLGIGLRVEDSAPYAGLLLAVSTIANLMWASVQASLYIELREWKEGSSVETLNEVFA